MDDISPSLTGDFNGDLKVDELDLDLLGEDAAAGNNTPKFDLTGDGLVSAADKPGVRRMLNV